VEQPTIDSWDFSVTAYIVMQTSNLFYFDQVTGIHLWAYANTLW